VKRHEHRSLLECSASLSVLEPNGAPPVQGNPFRTSLSDPRLMFQVQVLSAQNAGRTGWVVAAALGR
jgi:hypothetical protein